MLSYHETNNCCTLKQIHISVIQQMSRVEYCYYDTINGYNQHLLSSTVWPANIGKWFKIYKTSLNIGKPSANFTKKRISEMLMCYCLMKGSPVSFFGKTLVLLCASIQYYHSLSQNTRFDVNITKYYAWNVMNHKIFIQFIYYRLENITSTVNIQWIC